MLRGVRMGGWWLVRGAMGLLRFLRGKGAGVCQDMEEARAAEMELIQVPHGWMEQEEGGR